MGRRNNNIYVRSSELDTVEQGLTAVFEQEGYHRIPKPSPHVMEYYRRSYDYMRIHEDPRLDSLRAAALFPGGSGWTMMQTHPLEILCKCPPGVERPRIAALTVELGCDAFQLNLYHGDSLVLFEANADGQTAVSGGGSSTPEEIEKLIPEGSWKERFRLLHIPEEIQALLEDKDAYIVDQVETIAALLCGPSFNYWEDNTGDLVFYPNAELEAPGARALYFQRNTGPQIE